MGHRSGKASQRSSRRDCPLPLLRLDGEPSDLTDDEIADPGRRPVERSAERETASGLFDGYRGWRKWSVEVHSLFDPLSHPDDEKSRRTGYLGRHAECGLDGSDSPVPL
jgi:hypothetical protein